MAQADVVYHDDTGMRILSQMGKRRQATLAAQSSPESKDSAAAGGEPPPPDSGVLLTDGEPPPDTKCILPGGEPSPVDQQSTSAGGQDSLAPKRSGVFTTGIVATWREGRQAVLYVTGRKHAGENLRDLLNLREEGLEPPIQMCDALSRNMPKDLETILANCLAHGRRVFVDICEHFPAECLYVLQAFTLFLRKAGAPLDNNLCERVLKKAILHRKNSLFFKNENGAEVGDVYMSLIQTCELNGFNPWDYCHAVVRCQQAVAAHPAAWMPWNYQQTVASLSDPEPSPAAAVRQAS